MTSQTTAPTASRATTTERSVQHSTFVIERTFDAAPERVFQAFADPTAKARWFVGPERWQSSDHRLDFKVGGREHLSGAAPGGVIHVFDATYLDIVPNRRIVYSYDMYLNAAHISVSLATLELLPSGTGTRLVLTEQDAFLDGADFPAQREQGTQDLLDNLAAALSRS
jgi:uncharacterized protein YndB with AHSA1/START domain